MGQIGKVLVVNPPFVDDFCRTQRWAARTRGRVLRSPTWLAYATAVLEERGIDTELYDFPALRWGKDDLRRLFSERRPTHVVLDSTTPSIFSDIECARMAKDTCGAEVILVGPHASGDPAGTLAAAKGAVDALSIGEYDFSAADCVEARGDYTKVGGIWFSGKDGKPVMGPPRPAVHDIDTIPFPAWHHLDLLDYFDGTKLHPYIDIISGRGCPYQCTFCVWPQVMHGHKMKMRLPTRVVDEMERDIALCPEVLEGGEFFFEDDTFTLKKDVAIAICEEILRRRLKVRFSVNARADTADDELFRAMKAAGLRELLVGFESADDEILKNVKKKACAEDGRNFMRLAHKHEIEVHGCFVLGLPGETEATMQRTIDYALGLGLNTLQFAAAMPFPGTSLFREVDAKGLVKTHDWSKWLDEGEQASIIEYPGIDGKVLERYVNKGLESFYFRPSYMLKFLFKTESRRDLYRKVRGAYNFLSYLAERAKSDVWKRIGRSG
jgi:radical SAM superfamily enzyme YgiQ (UPF0313 family)